MSESVLSRRQDDNELTLGQKGRPHGEEKEMFKLVFSRSTVPSNGQWWYLPGN